MNWLQRLCLRGTLIVAAATVVLAGMRSSARRADAAALEERFRLFAENSRDVLWIANLDGTLLYVSPSCERVWGRPAPHLLRHPGRLDAHAHAEDRARVQGAWAAAATRGFMHEYRIVRPDGSIRWLLDQGFPIRDEGGRLHHIAGIAQDITDRKRAEHALRESERRFRTLVEQVRDYAIFMTDTEGCAISWNEGVRRVLGFDEAEFIGLDVARSLFVPEDVAAGVVEQELEQAVAAGAASNDRWMLRKDGTRFFASGITTVLRDDEGTPIGFSKVLRDLTEWKRADEALRQADRRKDEFLGMLAHELRNPLAPIRNALHIVRLNLAGNPARDGGAVHQALDIMDRQVRHLVRLVDDLLDVSRITHGKITLRMQPVALAQVVEQALEASAPLIENRRHRVEVALTAEPLWVNGDLTRLAQVLTNLLANAAKFTPDGGRIGLSTQRDMGYGVLRVRDSGIGIRPELLGSVFDLFVQADQSIDRSQGGLGIGLTLVRRLVEMHQGVVLAFSDGPGRGSEFVVRLPLLPPESKPAGALPSGTTGD